MKGHGSVQVYANIPYFYNFLNVSNELGLYHGSFKKPEELIPDIRNSAIDMVVFGTCEIECVQSLILKIFTSLLNDDSRLVLGTGKMNY